MSLSEFLCLSLVAAQQEQGGSDSHPRLLKSGRCCCALCLGQRYQALHCPNYRCLCSALFAFLSSVCPMRQAALPNSTQGAFPALKHGSSPPYSKARLKSALILQNCRADGPKPSSFCDTWVPPHRRAPRLAGQQNKHQFWSHTTAREEEILADKSWTSSTV